MKKILSLILALTFIFALIPTAFATDTQDFEISLNKFSGNIPVTQSVANKTNDLAWTITAAGDENAVVPFSPDNNSTPAMAIPFTCSNAGTYVPTLSWYDKDKGAANVEVYIVPEAEMKNLTTFVKNVDPADRLGKIDLYEAEGLTSSTALSKDLPKVSLSEGNYYFIMIAIGQNENSTGHNETVNNIHYISRQWFTKLAFKAIREMNVNEEVTYTTNAYAFNTTGENVTAWANMKYENLLDTVENKWEVSSYQNTAGNLQSGYFYLYQTPDNASKFSVTFKIAVPAAGKYSLNVSTNDFSNSAMGHACAKFQISDKADVSETLLVQDFEFYNSRIGGEIGTFTATHSGDYYIRMTLVDNESVREASQKTLKTTTANPNPTLSYYRLDLKALALTYISDTDANMEIATSKAQQQGVNGNPAVAEDGTAEATTNTVSYLKAFIGGEETNGVLSNKATLNADGTYTITADDAPEGYSFLYWTKGLQNNTDYVTKRIVSVLPEVTFKPEAEANYLIAVYGKTDDATQDAKYFNANGQLLEDDSTPTMPGYGAFKGWVHCGNNVYMADYEGAVNYTVTVNNDGKKVDELTRDYGTEVKVTAPARAGDGYRVFAYWEKNGEIVSFDRSYIFYAFEDCIVNAVYNDYAPLATSLRKIILTNIGNNNYMAEFIGFGNVPEKGIEVDGNRIAMTTNKTQFTIDAEKNTATVKGYVIDTDGKLYYSK